jgi:aryl-alcohol dehydrogenase-like predicted oxidoreductase
MRYRPFGGAGVAVSCVSLSLRDSPQQVRDVRAWTSLIIRAVEVGVNFFELVEPSEAMLLGVAQGLGAIERRLLFLSWRAPQALLSDASALQLAQDLAVGAQTSGMGHFDLLVVDEPPGAPTAGEVAAAAAPLVALTENGLVKLLGMRGEGDGLDAAIATGAFDAVATPYSLGSEWRERHRIKTASKRDMAVIGLDPYPQAMREAAKGAKPKRSSIWRRASDPLSGSGSYRFLSATPGWTAEEICLGYALTEPALSSVQVEADEADRIEALAEVPERDMPPALSAQIEMARFSPPPPTGERRRA